MTFKNIIDNHRKASEFIGNRKLGFALDVLYDMAKEAESDYFNIQLDKHRETYANILNHAFNALDDPKKEEIYQHLLMSVLEVGDQLREHLLVRSGSSSIYKTKWKLEQEIASEKTDFQELIERLAVDQSLDDLLRGADIQTEHQQLSQEERSELHSKLFRIIWLTDKYGDAEYKLLETINDSEKLAWYDKSLFVSALTLSVLRCFDSGKIELLFRFYEKGEEQVWHRALVGLIFAFYKYDNRIDLYPQLMDKLEAYRGDEELERNIEAIIIQTLKSKETEEITKKWEEEILPEILKMRPNIEKKLDLENIVSEKFFEDKNPEWEKVFEDSPDLLDKIQEFSKMQMEGSDVFMSAFWRLKHFSFFKRISNWFIPFYKENQNIASSVSADENQDLSPLVEKLETSHFMCNSDKYSFCLNLQYIPAEQKNTMMQLFNEEMKQMEEIGQDEELLNDFAKSKSIYTQYLQDIYRFFKIHPLKNEIEDIFEFKLDMYNTKFYNRIVENKRIRRNIAEFYFEREKYDQAVEVFKNLEESEQSEAEVIEKIAYSYQRMGDYQQALNYYHKAELYDTNKAWVTKKIALCYRYLDNPEKALEYYQEAENYEPDNLYIQAFIGHSLFQLQRYEEALQYYFKVEYLAPENAKIRRPIAWCSFVLGKYETAENYLHKLLAQESKYFDYITLGHVYWCMNDIEKAQEAYKNAATHEDSSFKQFAESFLDDRKYLEQREIDPLEVNLMLDRVKYSAEGTQ
ncbi:MAG: tetratricopeptide repeat protein [Bacteroidales bacterium]|nr:tetratricopeptide repeat protein [Bacteroidales bacterium]